MSILGSNRSSCLLQGVTWLFQNRPNPPRGKGIGWQSCLELFQKVERTDHLIAALFGGASLPASAIAAARPGDAGEAVVRDLLAALAVTTRGVENLRAQLAWEFSGKPKLASK